MRYFIKLLLKLVDSKKQYRTYKLDKLYQMTRNNKIVELLYFKGEISNKHINIKLCDEKENSDFTIVIFIII